jgi:serine/threonine-protein kinase SRK2
MQIANHMRLRHPHIIALHEVSCDQITLGILRAHEWVHNHQYPVPATLSQVFLTKTHLVLAMEYAAGGDLFRYVSARRGLPEDEARWFFQQLMVAVDYCHRMVRDAAPDMPRRLWLRSASAVVSK